MTFPTDTKAFRYTALQVAIQHFGDSLNRLEKDKQSEAEAIARRQYELQRRILNSDEAAGVIINKDQLDREVTSIISRYASEEEFQRELDLNQLDDNAFRDSINRNLRVDAVMERVAASAELCSETDARIYYYLHPEKFWQPETREARHILITVNDDFPENCRDAAFDRSHLVAKRLKKKPGRFSEQALKYSECPTAMQEGRLGRLKKGTLFPSLDSKLFAMSKGSVEGPIESPLGFHVLLCEAIYPEGVVEVREALPKIIEQLTERNRKEQQRAWLRSLPG